MLMHHTYVSVPVCTISIMWNFHTNPYQSTENYELKQQGDGAGETSITTNYELQGTGRATRAPVAQTLQSVRQTCSCTTATCLCTFVRFPSWVHPLRKKGICFTGILLFVYLLRLWSYISSNYISSNRIAFRILCLFVCIFCLYPLFVSFVVPLLFDVLLCMYLICIFD